MTDGETNARRSIERVAAHCPPIRHARVSLPILFPSFPPSLTRELIIGEVPPLVSSSLTTDLLAYSDSACYDTLAISATNLFTRYLLKVTLWLQCHFCIY